MDQKQSNLIDVSRLYSVKKYSEKFGVNYNTAYARFLMSAAGRGKNKYDTVDISGIFFIHVTEEQEAELLKKKGGK